MLSLQLPQVPAQPPGSQPLLPLQLRGVRHRQVQGRGRLEDGQEVHSLMQLSSESKQPLATSVRGIRLDLLNLVFLLYHFTYLLTLSVNLYFKEGHIYDM